MTNCCGHTHVTFNEFSNEERQIINEFLERWTTGPADDIGQQITDLLADRDIDVTDETAIRGVVERQFEEQQGQITQLYQTHARDAALAGRRTAARRFGLEIDFDILPERAIEATEEWATTVSQEVPSTLEDEVTRFIQSAHEDGLSIPDIADEFQENFVEGRLKDSKAEQLARDATIGPSRQGSHSANQSAPGVIAERWDTTLDGRERESHAEAHNQVVPVNGQFVVGDALLEHPHDPTGPIEETTMCRCSAIPLFRDELTEEQIAMIEAGERFWL